MAKKKIVEAARTIVKEAAYRSKLAPQIKERKAYNRAMKGGAVGGLSGQAAGFAAKKPTKIKWPVR